MNDRAIEAAEVVLACTELDPTQRFFTEQLGFRIEEIFPADDPRVATLSGHGLRLRLERGGEAAPGTLRLRCADPGAVADGATELTAPNGTRVELVAEPALVVPPVVPSLSVTRMGGDWGVGRAGMRYRDLIPDRQGGYVIASHIRIPDAGPVPDYVHFHKIRFQMIYCYRGWVRLVYEDQGPPFVMAAGDCVLQPPEIRHRVLESSAGLEVIEVGVPAEHMTCVEHTFDLPTDAVRPDRDFGGQRFTLHQVANATWQPWRLDGFEARDIGFEAATDGLASAKVVRITGNAMEEATRHDAELVFLFVLEGGVTLAADGHDVQALGTGDAVIVPAGLGHAFTDCAPDFELLEVTLPAAFATTPA